MDVVRAPMVFKWVKDHDLRQLCAFKLRRAEAFVNAAQLACFIHKCLTQNLGEGVTYSFENYDYTRNLDILQTKTSLLTSWDKLTGFVDKEHFSNEPFILCWVKRSSVLISVKYLKLKFEGYHYNNESEDE